MILLQLVSAILTVSLFSSSLTISVDGRKICVSDYITVRCKDDEEDTIQSSKIAKIERINFNDQLEILCVYYSVHHHVSKNLKFDLYKLLLSDHRNMVWVECLMKYVKMKKNCKNCEHVIHWCWNKWYKTKKRKIIFSSWTAKRWRMNEWRINEKNYDHSESDKVIRFCINLDLKSLHLFAESKTTKDDVITLCEYRHHNIFFTSQFFLTQHIIQIKLHHTFLTFFPSSLNQFHLSIHAHILIHQLSVTLLLSFISSLTNFQEHVMITVTS